MLIADRHHVQHSYQRAWYELKYESPPNTRLITYKVDLWPTRGEIASSVTIIVTGGIQPLDHKTSDFHCHTLGLLSIKHHPISPFQHPRSNLVIIPIICWQLGSSNFSIIHHAILCHTSILQIIKNLHEPFPLSFVCP